jgi:thiol-disulfide isomerase/thioredoxin
MKQKLGALATALTFFFRKIEQSLKNKDSRLVRAGAPGLPSLIGGTMPSHFLLDEKVTKESRLQNLWLKMLRCGAQSEAVTLRCTSTLFFITTSSHFFNAKFSEAGLAKWLCYLERVKYVFERFRNGLSLRCTSSLFFITTSSHFFNAKFSEAGLALWHCIVAKLKAEIDRLKAVTWNHILGLLKKWWKSYQDGQKNRGEFQKRYLRDRALRKQLEKEREQEGKQHVRFGALQYGFLFLIWGVCLGSLSVRAQEVKGLQIGEQVPSITFEQILGADGKSYAIGDFKGKVVLLDFWSTTCGSCIANMAHIFDLKESLKDSLVVLPVNGESRERIQKVWANNPNLKKLPLFTLYGDTVLKKLFPHQLFPHLVWIDREGRYVGATEAEYANEEHVRNIYQGNKTAWAAKNDQDIFDPQQVSLHAYLKVDTSRYFLPYLAGVRTQSRIVTEADSSIRYYAVNTNMVSQYAIGTYFEGLAFEPKRRVIDIPNIKAFEYHKAYGYQADWVAQYGYSYERYFPKGTRIDQIHQQLLKDHNKHFGLVGKIEAMPTAVLELRKTDRASTVLVEAAKGIKLSNWLAQLNSNSGLPWIVNQTGLGKSDFLPALPQTQTLLAIQKSLLPFGLELVPVSLNLLTFHLTKSFKP